MRCRARESGNTGGDNFQAELWASGKRKKKELLVKNGDRDEFPGRIEGWCGGL